MGNNIFNGYGVALVTPFLENGDVDYATLGNLVDFQINNGVDYICALGTTAETPTLDDYEYQSILSYIVKQVNGRVPIIAGCSDNCTQRLVRKLKDIDFSGVSAILSCVPSYNKPSQEGLYQHFMKVVEVSPLPIVLYNVPGRTGVNMVVQTVLRLSKSSDKFVAIKEASGNVQQIIELLKTVPSGFGVISGDDSLTMQLMESGAAGIISVIGNVLPKTFGDMVHLIQKGNFSEAESIHKRLEPLYGLLFKEGSPSGVKAIMSQRGMLMNTLRLPMTKVSDDLYNQIVIGFGGIEK